MQNCHAQNALRFQVYAKRFSQLEQFLGADSIVPER